MTDRPGGLDAFKELPVTSWAVRHGTSMLMLFAIIALAGVLAYRSVPKESFPEIEIPVVAVNTIYPGVSPRDMESLVTRVMEQELKTLPDLKELTSTSVEGYSSVVAEFSTEVDLQEALRQVREKVDLAKGELPADAEEPRIFEFDFQDVPILQVNLSGLYGLVRLKQVGEELEDRLEQIPSVLRVDLRGGREREVQVDVSLPRLLYYGLTLKDVVETVRNENVNIPGGSIDVGELKFLVRVDGEIDDPLAIGDLVVDAPEGRPVYVRDVADVDFGFAERQSYARLDGRPVVTLDVIKRTGENIIETSDAVHAAIAGMEAEFPPGTVVKTTSDMSRDIRMMVSSLENNILSGLLLIVAVLLFFLGVRTSVFVGIAIPTSMLLSFLVLGLLGVTMNMVVLFSLILALGMLVDNAIVIVENTYRYVEEGWDRAVAARKATGEVALPVIASTLTTVAAFGPLLFWPGIVGEFMKYLPTTLIVTLSSSLFVALVIVPVLCSRWLRVEGDRGHRLPSTGRWVLTGLALAAAAGLAAVNALSLALLAGTALAAMLAHRWILGPLARRFQGRGLPWLLDRYEGALGWALGHRLIVVAGSFAVLVAMAAAFSKFNNGIEFFPEDIPPRQVWVDVETPVGTRVEFLDGIARELELQVREVEGFEDAESEVTTVGSGGNPLMGGTRGANNARLMVNFADYQERRFDTFLTLARMQQGVGREIAGAEVSVDMPVDGPPQGAPVNIEIVGRDPAVLKDLSDRVLQVLRNAPVGQKLSGLESDLDEARPELAVHVDREKAALYGLSTAQVAGVVRTAIQGTEASRYRTGNDEYDVVVRLAEPWRRDLESLRDLVLENDPGEQIPLVSVASWTVGEGARLDPPQGHGPHGHDQLGRARRPQQERGARRGEDEPGALRRAGAAAGLHGALHRPVGGPGRGRGLPDHGLPGGPRPDRLHPGDPVQLGDQARHHPHLGHHVHRRGPPRAHGLPDALRDYHDRRRHHLPGRDRGQQRHRARRLHRRAAPPGRSRAPGRPHPGRTHAPASRHPDGDHHRPRPGAPGHRPQLRLLRPLRPPRPGPLLGRRAGGLVGTDGDRRDRGDPLRHLPDPDPRARDVLAHRRHGALPGPPLFGRWRAGGDGGERRPGSRRLIAAGRLIAARHLRLFRAGP